MSNPESLLSGSYLDTDLLTPAMLSIMDLEKLFTSLFRVLESGSLVPHLLDERDLELAFLLVSTLHSKKVIWYFRSLLMLEEDQL